MSIFLAQREKTDRQRHRRALAMARKLTLFLRRKYQPKRVVLIGSCCQPGRFNHQSDIDLCVEGLTPGRYFQTAGELLMESGEFQVDLIPAEGASPRLQERLRVGKVLYEKK